LCSDAEKGEGDSAWPFVRPHSFREALKKATPISEKDDAIEITRGAIPP
jgi:hypothetical protein